MHTEASVFRLLPELTDPLSIAHLSLSSPGDFLNEFFKLCCRKESTEEILGRGLTEEEGKG
jgi:hypothetical protein